MVNPLVRGLVHSAGAADFSPLDLFAASETGFLFDYSDTAKTFQVNDSQTPADEATEVVGMAWEESQWAGQTLAQVVAAATANLVTGWTNNSWDTFSTTGDEFDASKDVGGGTDLCYSSNGPLAVVTTQFYWINVDVDSETLATYFAALSATSNMRSSSVTVGSGSISGSVLPTSAGAWSVMVGTTATGGISVTGASVKHVVGNHAYQTTTAQKPTRQAGGIIRFDGVDDRLLSTVTPSAAMTLAARFVRSGTGATDKVIGGGASTTSTRCYLSVNAAGKLGGGVGAQSDTTIQGTTTIDNVTGVGILTFDGATVKLYWEGVEEYSAAQSGDPAGGAGAFTLGAWNNNGVPADFLVGDISDALILDRAIDATEAANLTTYWNA